jgi:hypothetical protein
MSQESPVSDECVREMLAALRECANRLRYAGIAKANSQ